MNPDIKEVETTETEAARFPVGAALGAAVGSENSEEVEPVTEEPEFISNEDYRELLALAINDAEVWVSQAESLINKIDNGEKIKGTKLNGAVRNGRLEILRSSLTDVKTAKVSG
jgi:hypothetical protein